MSHPDPSHEKENEYPEDKVSHYPKKKEPINHAMHRIGSKAKALKKMMSKVGKFNLK